jgi:protein TonB
MTSLLHTLNISTLAAWLSVAGFGTVGILVPDWRWTPEENPVDEQVTDCLPPEIMLDSGISSPESTAPSSDDLPPEPSLDALPEIPQIPEVSPLPELPNLPPPPKVSPKAANNPIARPTQKQSTPKTQGTARKSRSTSGASTSQTGGSGGMSNSARLAAGRMQAPNYPSAARRAGQTGTVTVAFTVDNSGKVISAHAVNPSPWPLLNEEAVRTVRHWKFPPGGVMKLQRPIVFQLR